MGTRGLSSTCYVNAQTTKSLNATYSHQKKTTNNKISKLSKCYALQHSLTTFLASSDLTQSLYVNEVEVIHHSSYRAKKTSFNNKYFM